MSDNIYCPLPFKHVFVEPRGVKPCCSYVLHHDGTISDWINSKELKNLQEKILNNEVTFGCESCLKNEKKDGYSTRLSALRDYENQVFTKIEIDYVDYRPSNICNFRCRSCEPFFSNGIANESKKYPELAKFYPAGLSLSGDDYIPMHQLPQGKTTTVTEDNYQWLIDNIKQIKKLMFTGGEPTKIQQVREIIDHIRQEQLKDINILITSNASFTDQYWIDITKELPNIHWTLSVDIIGQNAEIVRNGTDWNVVSRNIETMFDVGSSVNIGTVITNLNVFSIGELFKWANNLKEKYQERSNGRTQFISICTWPKHMSPYNWPQDLKDKLLKYLGQIDLSSLQDRQLEVLQTLINNIKAHQFDSTLWNDSIEFNTILDNLRGQQHQQLFLPRYGV